MRATIKVTRDGHHDPSYEVRAKGTTLASFTDRRGAEAYVRLITNDTIRVTRRTRAIREAAAKEEAYRQAIIADKRGTMNGPTEGSAR